MAMTLRLTDSIDTRLTRYTDLTGVSKNQFILDAIEAQLDLVEQKSATRDAVRRIVQRDAELLERLSDA
jgi:predicted DNA-binding protein